MEHLAEKPLAIEYDNNNNMNIHVSVNARSVLTSRSHISLNVNHKDNMDVSPLVIILARILTLVFIL